VKDVLQRAPGPLLRTGSAMYDPSAKADDEAVEHEGIEAA
jgi:hypothetical protein